ncbi:MAG: hypothetical protein KGZ38_06135 [Erysipelothrix sp.]|jgi:hypothetical protein|nr:hypothetical protein [Erysipelothrix sp.]
MSIYRENLEEELKRNLDSQNVFSKRLAVSVRGSICKKKINEHEYYYLKYRKNNKIVTKYIGAVEKIQIDKLQKEIDKANEFKRVLNELKKNEIKLRKAIKVL